MRRNGEPKPNLRQGEASQNREQSPSQEQTKGSSQTQQGELAATTAKLKAMEKAKV